MPSPLKSAVVIGRLLSTEGFSDFLANQIDRYEQHNILTDRQKLRYQQTAKSARVALGTLTTEQKAVVGKFIQWQKRMSFDTGLRIGLTAHAVKNGKEIEPAIVAEAEKAGA